MKGSKVSACVSTILWYVLLFWTVAILREFTHSYEHWLRQLGGPTGGSLPWLARSAALPVLGLRQFSDTGPWLFYAFWLAVFVPPGSALVVILRAPDRTATLERWIGLWFPYICFIALAVVTIVFGLWLPFSLL
jgi:hypothetical protein